MRRHCAAIGFFYKTIKIFALLFLVKFVYNAQNNKRKFIQKTALVMKTFKWYNRDKKIRGGK